MDSNLYTHAQNPLSRHSVFVPILRCFPFLVLVRIAKPKFKHKPKPKLKCIFLFAIGDPFPFFINSFLVRLFLLCFPPLPSIVFYPRNILFLLSPGHFSTFPYPLSLSVPTHPTLSAETFSHTFYYF